MEYIPDFFEYLIIGIWWLFVICYLLIVIWFLILHHSITPSHFQSPSFPLLQGGQQFGPDGTGRNHTKYQISNHKSQIIPNRQIPNRFEFSVIGTWDLLDIWDLSFDALFHHSTIPLFHSFSIPCVHHTEFNAWQKSPYRFGFLVIGIWWLFVIWDLCFGASIIPSSHLSLRRIGTTTEWSLGRVNLRAMRSGLPEALDFFHDLPGFGIDIKDQVGFEVI